MWLGLSSFSLPAGFSVCSAEVKVQRKITPNITAHLSWVIIDCALKEALGAMVTQARYGRTIES